MGPWLLFSYFFYKNWKFGKIEEKMLSVLTDLLSVLTDLLSVLTDLLSVLIDLLSVSNAPSALCTTCVCATVPVDSEDQ